jgi:hypothetical protein
MLAMTVGNIVGMSSHVNDIRSCSIYADQRAIKRRASNDWFEQLVEQGRATSGHPLAYQGKIVSGKKGHTVVDGPFVESKEAIGGYFLLQVESEEEAIEIARHCPGLEHGVQVEVRPLVEFCPSGEVTGQAAEQPQGGLSSDKLLRNRNGRVCSRLYQAPSHLHGARRTGASTFFEFSVQRDYQCRRDHSWSAQEFLNDEADVVSAETKRVAHGDAHLCFTSGPGDVI